MPPHIHISVDRLRRRRSTPPSKKPVGDGKACKACGAHFRAEELERNWGVCTTCDHHFPVSSSERITQLADGDEWRELWSELAATDPLRFTDLVPYTERVEQAEAKGVREALVVGELSVQGVPSLAAVMDFGFLGGSMGSVVGEKFARAADRCVETGRPLSVITASGGARMQEGVIALMQMAKTVVAIDDLREAAIPVVVVLAHPTTGGVWASFASMGDFTYAEPGALIAFSGPRVIEQTTREKLPPEFGLAESQLENGQVDAVVDRRELPGRIGSVLNILDRPRADIDDGAGRIARQGRERASRAAQALPKLSRRLRGRLGTGSDGGAE